MSAPSTTTSSSTRRPTRRRSALLGLPLAGVLALTACGGGDALSEGGSGGGASEGSGGGSVTVGGATFTEMAVMEAMYAALLEDAGYDVTVTATDERATYADALLRGEVDVLPEYAASMADFLAGEPISTADIEGTMAAFEPVAEEQGLVLGEPAEASSDNAFYVTQEYSDAEGVTTLTQFGEAQSGPVEMAAGQECLDATQQPFCAAILESAYGITVGGVTGDGFGSITGKQKVADGQVPIGISGTTDATLADLGLVLLEDDQEVQPANNLVPVVNAEAAEADPALLETLNQLAPVLTTEDLAELNAQVDQERLLPEDVARDYLVEKGLVEG